MATQARNISDSIFSRDRAAYGEESLTLGELQDLIYNLTVADPELRDCDLLLTRDGWNEFYASIVRRAKQENDATHQPSQVLIFSGPSRTRQNCLRELLFGLEREAHDRVAEHTKAEPMELEEETVFDDTGCRDALGSQPSLNWSTAKVKYEDDSLTSQLPEAGIEKDVVG